MKKISGIIILLFVIFNINNYAQLKATINGGVQLPVGDFKTNLKSGYGGSISADISIPLSPVSIALTAGYNKWNYKNESILAGYDFTAIPLMAGVRYYSPGRVVGPYIGGDIGMTITNSNNPFVESSTDFTFSPVAGVRINFSPVGLVALDINARYWVVTTKGFSSKWIGLNAGIAFGL